MKTQKEKSSYNNQVPESSECYYIPEILFKKPYSSYSSEAKILLGITISMAENASSIIEVAEILNRLGKENISALFNDLQELKARGDS